jgi:hypothetical protein
MLGRRLSAQVAQSAFPFASMNSDLGEESRAIHEATAAFLLVHDCLASYMLLWTP